MQDLSVDISDSELLGPASTKDLGMLAPLERVAALLREGKCTRVIVMSGAGLSCAAGIPDFRTPGTGLYDNLHKYDLPHPTAVFEIDYFRENPKPFFTLAKELYPGNFGATLGHYFIRLLHEKGVLVRNYTQNIDTLEMVAGLPPSKVIEAHGSFAAAHCVDCERVHSVEYVKRAVFADEIPKCEGESCGGLVKPDIVFFGEGLPKRFFDMQTADFAECDLLLVMGTSLQVHPFAGLIHKVDPKVPRVLINLEEAGVAPPMLRMLGLATAGFDFRKGSRDTALLGDCQDTCWRLARCIGWAEDLRALAPTDCPGLPPVPAELRATPLPKPGSSDDSLVGAGDQSGSSSGKEASVPSAPEDLKKEDHAVDDDSSASL